MSYEVTVGDVIVPADNDDVKEECTPKASSLHVLAVVPAHDCVWAIELARDHPSKPSRKRWYFRAPVRLSLSELEAQLSQSLVCLSRFESRAELQQLDQDVLKANHGRQRKRWKSEFKRRDDRFKIIEPLVRGGGRTIPFLQIISDPQLASRIEERARERGCAISTVYNLLHQFWALGSTPNALCTSYWRCGCPGVPKEKVRDPKKEKIKLGRRSRRNKAELESRGYVSGPSDHENMRWCYLRIKRGVTPANAYLRMCQMHYADRTISPEGRVVHVLWDPLERPTKSEFLYWGAKLNDEKSISRIVLGEKVWDQTSVSRGGSVQDQVTMVGQLANYDSTTTDKYYSTPWSRLQKLPPAWRLLLRDVRSEVIVGIDVSWESPSQVTAMRCLLNAASSKVEFCARFKVTITDDDWPAMLPLTVQTDHGEMKGEVTSQCEAQFGFSMDYVPAASGNRKGGIEGQHQSDHKKVDHQAPGTTHGRARRRGESDPVQCAGWNYYEAMEEYIHAILDHNNQERPEIAPTAMLRDYPHIRPTRLNIFKWLRDHGQTAELPCNTELMRTFMLPAWPAVIRENGVWLKAEIDGYERVLLKMRYASKQLVASGLLSQVKRTGKSIASQVRLDENAPRFAWLITGKGPIALELADDDTILREQTTLKELCLHMQEDDLVRAAARGQRDQAASETYERRQQKDANARSQARREVKERGKEPTARAKRANLHANRVKQIELLKRESEATMSKSARPKPAPKRSARPQDRAPALAQQPLTRAADRVMDAYNARRT